MARILSAQPDFEIVGEAGDGLEAIVMARGLEPDLVLMDISMPGTDGVEAITAIKCDLPDVIIVMLTIREEDEILFEALSSGAQGYLLKTTPSAVLIDLLRGTMYGHAAITPALAGRLLGEFRRLEQEDRQRETPLQPVSLTQRELEVLSLVAQGKGDLEIAELLTISIHTVKTHVRNILSKLQLDGRSRSRPLCPPP